MFKLGLTSPVNNLLIMASSDEYLDHEPVVAPPMHGLVPLPTQQTNTGQANSDFESVNSIETCAKNEENTTCSHISFNQFKRSMKIKKKYIPSKVSYFLFFSSRSILATYFMVFMATSGLDPEQVGCIQGIRMIFYTSGGMFWAMLADRSNKDLLIVVIEICSFALLMLSKPWVTYWITQHETDVEHREHVLRAVVDILTTTNSTENLGEELLNSTNKEISDMFGLDWSAVHYKTGSTPLFVSMLGIGIVSAFFGGGIQILLDARVMKFSIATSKNKSTYGRQRLWGSVAYSISPVLCGAVLEILPENKVSPFMPVFYIHVGLMALSLASFVFLFRQDITVYVATAVPEASDHGQNTNEQSISRFLITTIKNVHMTIFLCNALWIGVGNGLQWSFQFIFLSEMNATKITMGICALTQCGTEAIIFPMASKINKLIGGNKAAITLGMLGYAFTFLIFSMSKTPIFVVTATPIIGFFFTLFYTASMEELHKASTPKCMTTLYAFYNGILVGIGNALAGVIGGIIYKQYGGRILFLSFSVLFFFLGCINIVYAILYKHTPLTNYARRADEQRNYKQFLDIYVSVEPSTTPPTIEYDDAILLVIDDENKV